MSWQDDQEPEDYDFGIDKDDLDDDPEHDQLSCPSCGRMIFDDTDRCPYCGDWIMPLAASATNRGNWVWWTALILAAVMLITWGIFG